MLGTNKISADSSFRGWVEHGDTIANMTGGVSSSIFAETFNQGIERAKERYDLWSGVLSNAAYELSSSNAFRNLQEVETESGSLTSPPTGKTAKLGIDSDRLTPQLAQVARLMNAHVDPNVDTERDLFFVQMGGFDTHYNNMNSVQQRYAVLNHALDQFQSEMERKGLWDNVTIVLQSDFGRTMKSNSGQGTDHGWGGNYFVMGGDVKGQQILGKYPPSFDTDNEHMLQGGRMVPSTSWESVWYGLADWIGVEKDQFDKVLPHLKNFPEASWIQNSQMFSTPKSRK